eukprot:3215201-Rhodomonas_salina.2
MKNGGLTLRVRLGTSMNAHFVLCLRGRELATTGQFLAGATPKINALARATLKDVEFIGAFHTDPLKSSFASRRHTSLLVNT